MPICILDKLILDGMDRDVLFLIYLYTMYISGVRLMDCDMVPLSLGKDDCFQNNLHEKTVSCIDVLAFDLTLHCAVLIISISFDKAFCFPSTLSVFLTSYRFLAFHLLPLCGVTLHPRIKK